jgi:hypothetical protein
MDPLTIDDLMLLIGQKEAQILQLQRHVAKLQPKPGVVSETSPNGALPVEEVVHG